VGEYVEQKLKPQIKENKEELTEKKIDEEKLLEENQALLKKLEALQTALNQKDKVEQKEKKQRVIKLKDIDEKTTRENLIDIELLEAGFDISSFKTGKDIEYKFWIC
jgi:regulator of replication initiation timing